MTYRLGHGFTARKDRTPEYLQCVDLLYRLQQERGDADRAAAEVLSPVAYESFQKRHKVKPSRSSCACPHWLIRPRPAYCDFPCPEFKGLPWDHVDIWIRDGKPACITSQPYGIGGKAIAALERLRIEHNLEITIEAGGSWHFPGSTALVTISLPEQQPAIVR